MHLDFVISCIARNNLIRKLFKKNYTKCYKNFIVIKLFLQKNMFKKPFSPRSSLVLMSHHYLRE